uniref:Uncharacterized protein n=2 Tax=Meloidogyne TaxID=189290 RepID=A0A6V7Y0X5_MELEN|nr:unnamed protein product [Meloidogyne enterolobii]CAD2205269.1 unnamed protein product [Meloidogyne enterolobii]
MFFKCLLIVSVYLNVSCVVNTSKVNKGGGKEPAYSKIIQIGGSSNFKETLKLLKDTGKQPEIEEKANSKSGSKGKDKQNLEKKKLEQAKPRIFDLKSLGNPYGYEIGSMLKGKQKVEMKTPEQAEKRIFDLKANGINPIIYSEQISNYPIVWNKNKGPAKFEGEGHYKAKNSPKTTLLTLRRALSLGSSVSEEDFEETPTSQGKKHSGLRNKLKRIGSSSKRNNKGVPVGPAKRGSLKRFFTKTKGKKNHMDNEIKKAKNSEEDKIAGLINMLTMKDDSSEDSPVNFSDTTLKMGDGSSFSSSNPLSMRSSLDKSFPYNHRISDVAKETENFEDEDLAYKQRLSDVAKETENFEDYDSEDLIELNPIKGDVINKALKRKHEADAEEDDGFEEYEINSDREIKLVEQKKMSKIQKIGK